MSSCLEIFGAVGQWVINLLNCLEPCLKYREVELIISVVSVILGLVDVITDWINWNSWRKNPGLLEQDYYTKLLKYITIFGTVLFVCDVILLFLKLCFRCLPDNDVHPFNEDDSHSQFMYAPYKFKGAIYLLWDISTVHGFRLQFSHCNRVQICRSTSQIRSHHRRNSVVNSIWLLCVSLFNSIWTCTIPGPTRQLTEPNEDDHALCRFTCTLWAPIFTLGFLLTFLIPCYSLIDSVFIHVVNGLLIFDIVILCFSRVVLSMVSADHDRRHGRHKLQCVFHCHCCWFSDFTTVDRCHRYRPVTNGNNYCTLSSPDPRL